MMRNWIVLIILMVTLPVSCRFELRDLPIRIGIIRPSINHLPLEIARQKGYLDKMNLRVIQFSSGWEAQEAITAGQIDLAVMPFTYAWTSIARGKKLRIISCFERETDGIVVGKGVWNIRELNNKKIGVLRASTLEILLQDAARVKGFTYKPVYFRTPSELVEALKAAEVDAITCYVPLVQKLGKEHKVLYWFSESYPSHPCCDLVATEKIIRSHSSDLLLLRTGLRKAMADITNPDKIIIGILKTGYGLSDEQTAAALKHTRFDDNLTQADMDFERRMMNYFVINKYLTKLPPESKVYQLFPDNN